MTAQPARERLLDLACETRPDLDRDDLSGAISALTTAGWTWGRVLVAVAQMCARDEEPRDLRNAVRALPPHRSTR